MATSIATSTFGSNALPRAGARAIVKRSTGDYMVLYYTGTNAVTKMGSDLANVAAATALTVVSMNNSADPSWGHLIGNPAVSNGETFMGYHNGAGGPVRYHFGGSSWSSVSDGYDGGGFVPMTGFLYDSTHFWMQCGYKSNFASSPTGAHSWITQFSSGDDGYVATAWNGLYLTVIYTSAGALHYNDGDSVTSPSGVNFPTDTSLETGLTTNASTNDSNLSITTDSNGNAWLLYVDNSGIAVRYRPAGGGSWSAKTRITSQSTDFSPAIMHDTSGNVWCLWIDGGSGNAIKTQAATISGGAISLTGSVVTLESTSATRDVLHVLEEDDTNLVYVWSDSTGTTTVYGNTYSISSGSSVTGAASLATDGDITAAAIASYVASATLPIDANMTATGARAVVGDASLIVDAVLTGAAIVAITGSADLSVDLNATAQAIMSYAAAAGRSVDVNDAVTAAVAYVAASTLSTDANLTATGIKAVYGAATLAADGNLSANAVMALAAAVVVQAQANLSADSIRAVYGASTLQTDAVQAVAGQLHIAAQIALAADANTSQLAALALVGASALQTAVNMTATAHTVNTNWRPPTATVLLQQTISAVLALQADPSATIIFQDTPEGTIE